MNDKFLVPPTVAAASTTSATYQNTQRYTSRMNTVEGRLSKYPGITVFKMFLCKHRCSYLSARILLKLFNELGESDKMQAC